MRAVAGWKCRACGPGPGQAERGARESGGCGRKAALPQRANQSGWPGGTPARATAGGAAWPRCPRMPPGIQGGRPGDGGTPALCVGVPAVAHHTFTCIHARARNSECPDASCGVSWTFLSLVVAIGYR